MTFFYERGFSQHKKVMDQENVRVSPIRKKLTCITKKEKKKIQKKSILMKLTRNITELIMELSKT